MSNENSNSGGGMKSLFASLSIVFALGVSVLIYVFILGDASNFDAEGHPVTDGFRSYLGMMYQGGFIVPILIGIFLTVIIFAIERAITISRAKGKGQIEAFVRNIKKMLNENNLDGAIAECDRQKGSLANVIRAGVEKYKLVKNDPSMDKEMKAAAVQKELEEATSLELPMLSKNLVILSTCASIATLWGLIGTVIGMIRAFAAMSHGAPDTAQLAVGISEALINTALGITGSVFGIIFYNLFTNKIDSLTYSMDEAGFSIVQTVNSHK